MVVQINAQDIYGVEIPTQRSFWCGNYVQNQDEFFHSTHPSLNLLNFTQLIMALLPTQLKDG